MDQKWIYMLIILVALFFYVAYFIRKNNRLNREESERRAKEPIIPVKEDVVELKEVAQKDEKPVIKPEPPIPFGFKCAWLAVKTSDRRKLEKCLEIKEVKEANWSMGLEVAYEKGGRLFFTPAMDNWVIMIGVSLPDAIKDRQKLTDLLIKLSKEFGEAQYFGTHRVTEYQAWVKAVNGNIVRAVAYSGERQAFSWVAGEPTKIEKELGLDYKVEDSAKGTPDTVPSEMHVHQVSMDWSIDTFFENKTFSATNGIIGRLK